MSEAKTIWSLFDPLWADIESETSFPKYRPLLAHYTSIDTLENILKGNQLWLSNPLLMNDLEEVRFGMNNGKEIVLQSNDIKNAFQTNERYEIFLGDLLRRFENFERNESLDVYIFCLSHHIPGDNDGKLSMWRGYGADGRGVALIIDTAKIPADNGTPFVVAPVIYATSIDRTNWIKQKVSQFSEIVKKSEINNESIYFSSAQLFDRILLFSLYSKHKGFSEENEWRLAYLRNRDYSSIADIFLSYGIGPNGLEPKLKLDLKILGEKLGTSLSIDEISHGIILGPHVSSPLSSATFVRMLKNLGMIRMAASLANSSIPYRATK